jgi:hypothetical protein
LFLTPASKVTPIPKPSSSSILTRRSLRSPKPWSSSILTRRSLRSPNRLYEAKDTKGCTARDRCVDCLGFGDCWAVEKGVITDTDMATDGYPEVSISEHGFVSEEKPMMKEILLRMP